MNLNVIIFQYENWHRLKIAIKIKDDEYNIICPEYAGDLHLEINESTLFKNISESDLPYPIMRAFEWPTTRDGIVNILIYK